MLAGCEQSLRLGFQAFNCFLLAAKLGGGKSFTLELAQKRNAPKKGV